MNNNEKKDLQLVKVYIRERPWTKSENELKRSCTVHKIEPKQITLKSGVIEKSYTFDHVFDKTSRQEEVYEVVVSPLIDFVLSGYTCTVFAYGQTGTGKTYTMIGQDLALNIEFVNDPSVGMVPRAAMDLFAELNRLNVEYTMRVSFVEIYNEDVRDLLISESAPLRVFEDPDNKGSTCIKGLTEVAVKSVGELYHHLNKGAAERQIASTNLNRLSSRSHTIFTIVLCIREVTAFGEEIIKTGKLHLIDLAGSENIGRSGATEMRAREAGSINKSLLTLGKVIKSLALKMQHIPYRESKLTRILQDSLGGKSKTCMIATFASCLDSFDETISTLDYANMARSVANCPTVNINRNQTQVLTDSQNELVKLRQELNAMRTGDGFYMSNTAYDEMTHDIKTKQQRVLHLVEEIKALEERIAAQEKQCDELNNTFQSTSSLVENVKTELIKTENEQKLKARAASFLDGSILILKDKSRTLSDVCNTSTKHEDIYYKKYQNQCISTISNANVARNIYATSTNCFNEIYNLSNNLLKNQANHVGDGIKRAQIMKENQLQNLAHLDQVLTDLHETSQNSDLTSEDIFVNKKHSQDKLVALYDSSSDACLQSLQDKRKSIEEVHSYVLATNLAVEEQTTECRNLVDTKFKEIEENKVKIDSHLDDLFALLERCRIQQQLFQINKNRELLEQLLQANSKKNEEIDNELEAIENMEKIISEAMTAVETGYVKSLLDVQEGLTLYNKSLEPLQPVPSLLQNTVDTFERNTTSCKTKIKSCQSQAQKCFSEFAEASAVQLARRDNEMRTKLRNWADEVDAIKENLQSTVQKNVEHINRQIQHVTLAENTYQNDLQQFVQKSYEDLQITEKDLKTTVHAGDTPVKVVYKYPTERESDLSEEMLQQVMRF